MVEDGGGDDLAGLLEPDPPGPAERHGVGCTCGKCLRWCLGDDPPWQAPYRLRALANPGEAERMRLHEELVGRGRWLAQARGAFDAAPDPPTLTEAIDEYLERLANRSAVSD